MKDNPIEFFNESHLKVEADMHLAAAVEARRCVASDFDRDFGWVNIVLLPSKDHTILNIKYLDHDYATDILTFEYPEDGLMCGEVYINADILVENSNEYNVSVGNELNRLIIHGLLHLAGLKDHTDVEQEVMTLNENKYLEKLELKGFM